MHVVVLFASKAMLGTVVKACVSRQHALYDTHTSTLLRMHTS